VSKKKRTVVKTRQITTYYYKGGTVTRQQARQLKELGVRDVEKRVTDEMIWEHWK
jgi:hypothetical protein